MAAMPPSPDSGWPQGPNPGVTPVATLVAESAAEGPPAPLSARPRTPLAPLSPEPLAEPLAVALGTPVVSAPFAPLLLPRQGLMPLRLSARLLLEANNNAWGCAVWSEIAILETEDGRFVAVLRHWLEGRARPAYCNAVLCENVEAVRATFARHDPVAVLPFEALTGPLPDQAVDEETLARAGRQVLIQRARWRALLGGIFGPFDSRRPGARPDESVADPARYAAPSAQNGAAQKGAAQKGPPPRKDASGGAHAG
ncbi:hypothetical protein NON00_08535 [Roseomonas sp. GC11]|uniref:hypothetical protein n=1 Tax=Roseomonas sp. GC11 TaxID=2950546 RepID=UPI00210B3995|nr:hypothetical protein [Roseomonas sp. GC11]MCQ4159976.1 hypothetical protein [Roseomonas sp. GC11]